MSTTVCLNCFKFKYAPWVLCLHCGHQPVSAKDKLKHLIFTDSVVTQSFLDRYSEGRQRNERVDMADNDVLPGKAEFMRLIFAMLERAESGGAADLFLKNFFRSIEDSSELTSREQIEQLFSKAMIRSMEDASQPGLRLETNPDSNRRNPSGCASGILMLGAAIVGFVYFIWIHTHPIGTGMGMRSR